MNNRIEAGFNNRIVRYEDIHKVKSQDYDALLSAIDVAEGSTIFEGCSGYGDISQHILEATKTYKDKPILYILDESPVQIERAKEQLKGRVDHILLGDIRETHLPNDFFDRVVIKMGVHELPKDEQKRVFAEMFRILKPRGKFIIWELSLTDKTQKIFQDIVRKKDTLAGFNQLVNNRYFQKHDELIALYKNTGFSDIKDEYKMRYTFNPRGRFEELISKDRLEMKRENNLPSKQRENELQRRAEQRVQELISYIKSRLADTDKELVEYKDLGDDVELTVDKIIMSGRK